ncbi:MAG: hypothetical protein E7641_07875 [Ruminococcaceae bacterium]|nr:hypothetical protein [Oscillospiraceae bacterium]
MALLSTVTEKIKNNRKSLVLCALTAAICALFAGVLASKTFSPAEGWYSYYAYLVNEEGAVPYLDFELLFPPLYTYIIAFITKIFGYSIMPLRIVGVIIFALLGAFAYLIFEKLTRSPFLGFLGGLLSAAMIQCEVVQIFYDYIRFMDLCVYISIYCFLVYLDRFGNTEKQRLYPAPSLVLGTVFAVFASMFKQSSGLFFLIFCFAAIIFLAIFRGRKRELIIQLCSMTAITAAMYGIMFAFIASKGAFEAYIRYNFVSSVDAKGGGSIISVLFGWIPRSAKSLALGALAVLIPIGLFLLFSFLSKKYPESEKSSRTLVYIERLTPALALILVVLPMLSRGFANLTWDMSVAFLMYPVFLFTSLFFLAVSLALIFNKKLPKFDGAKHNKYIFFSGAVFVLSYSVCTSGGLAESQTALGYGFMIVLLLAAARFRKKEIAALALSLLMLFQTTYAFSRKLICTYAWWGLSTGTVFEQTETTDVPLLKGISMNPKFARMYNNVYKHVTENTSAEDEIFVFPHMPILYLATDRDRATNTIIQWFDVATDEAVLDDIKVIEEKKPKAIVICTVSEYVMASHEASFRAGNDSGLRIMQDFLFEFVVDEGYDCASIDKVSDGYTVSVWILNND